MLSDLFHLTSRFALYCSNREVVHKGLTDTVVINSTSFGNYYKRTLRKLCNGFRICKDAKF